ncbi:hypothetical protein PILCRDRAFT_825840 [Piloderma croceum F 1598]|uniref:Endopeptidase S2P n=1 Tax=Piloderma croceum (strain F 1598) TaxID=765440 RepID=A0A0C3FAU6_PILCF|nr:hypothetical protein PILCRDRAFT_825840 [Piloderma croceum F 1598]
MTVGTLCLSLSLLWLVIHAVHNARTHKAHVPLLPTTSPHLRANSQTHITLKHLHIHIQTTAWNPAHERLAALLASKHYGRVKKVLIAFYDLGAGMGVVGMGVGVGVLLWTFWELVVGLIGSGEVGREVVKRTMEATRVVQTGRASLLQPIIPGVTVPLTHLPLIFISVFVCQIIHEAGHALSAALEQIPLIATGLSLTLILPSAFVTFPSPPNTLSSAGDTQKQKSLARMRLVAAGAWHNLVFWGVLLFFTWACQGWSGGWGYVGYKDMSGKGRVVLGFDEDSQLRDHLPLGAVITKLDDVPLARGKVREGNGRNEVEDVWSSYLDGTYRPTEWENENREGWCVDRAWWMDKPTACCDDHHRTTTNEPTESRGSTPLLYCFSSLPTPAHGQSRDKCLDPIPLLTNPYSDTNSIEDHNSPTPPLGTRGRCSSSNPCGGGEECVRLREDERILRITFRDDPGGREEVVLWSGPRVEVLEQVEVGTLRPRFWFLPLGLPGAVRVFFNYLQMATLSLYIFNLLPLPFLDGTQLLDAILDFILVSVNGSGSYSDTIDLEALEDGRGRGGRMRGRDGHARLKYWIGRIVRAATLGLCTGCVGLGVINLMVGG